MRTWLVLAAVLAVAAAAVADALRGDLTKASQREPLAARATARIVPPGVPAGFMGTVDYSDPGDQCRVHTLALPGFASGPPPKFRGCRFSLSPDGRTALPRGAVWQPQGGLVAIPRGASFELGSPASRQTLRIAGTAPSFKPDGTLTYVRDGELVEWTTRCGLGDRLFTLPGDNGTARCARTLFRGSPTSVAWLTGSLFAAVLRGGRLTVGDGSQQWMSRPLPSHESARVEASPRGTFFTVWLDGRLAGAFDSGGGRIAMPPISGVRALAWSPSERWGMLATARGSVYLFRPNTGDARLRRLEISARDLAWR